jgi:hypothetical protein
MGPLNINPIPYGKVSPPTKNPYTAPTAPSRQSPHRLMRQKWNQKGSIALIPSLSLDRYERNYVHASAVRGVGGAVGSVALRHQLAALGVHP